MRFSTQFLAAATVLTVTAANAETYPIYRTEPLTMAHHDQMYYRDLFQTMAKMVSTKQHGEKILVLVLRMLKNADDTDYAICGGGLIGEVGTDRKDILFAYTHKVMYSGLTWGAWKTLGCQTRGGTWIESKVKKVGSPDLVFVASQDPIPKKEIRPAVPPSGPLPFGARQRIALKFEDSLSQIMGTEVTLLSARDYKEEDGSSTSCTVGNARGHRFRIAEIGSQTPIINPTDAQWVAAGCTRNGYQLIR